MTDNFNSIQNNNNFREDDIPAEVSSYIISDKVLAKITRKVIDKVDGILDLQGGFLNSITSTFSNADDSTSGISITQQDNNAIVETGIVLEYGKKAPIVFKELEHAIKQEISDLTGINVVAVKANIVDIMTKDEYNKRKQLPETKREY